MPLILNVSLLILNFYFILVFIKLSDFLELYLRTFIPNNYYFFSCLEYWLLCIYKLKKTCWIMSQYPNFIFLSVYCFKHFSVVDIDGKVLSPGFYRWSHSLMFLDMAWKHISIDWWLLVKVLHKVDVMISLISFVSLTSFLSLFLNFTWNHVRFYMFILYTCP